jgi:DNA-directed RNA polymerase specialized sigma24 family protein
LAGGPVYDFRDESAFIVEVFDSVLDSGALTSLQRQSVGLVRLLGYRRIDAARRLGISRASVCRHVQKADRILMKEFTKHGIGLEEESC